MVNFAELKRHCNHPLIVESCKSEVTYSGDYAVCSTESLAVYWSLSVNMVNFKLVMSNIFIERTLFCDFKTKNRVCAHLYACVRVIL